MYQVLLFKFRRHLCKGSIGRSCTLKEVGNFRVKGWAQVEMKQLRKLSLKLEISNAFPYFALPITVIPFSKILRHVTSLILG